MTICWICTYPQTIKDLDKVVISSKQIWRNLALHHLDPLQWMGAVRMRVQINIYNKQICLSRTLFFASLDTNWWTGVMWITCGLLLLFLSADGTHSTQRIHWWASDVMLHFYQIGSDEQTNSSTFWMAWGWIHFHFWVTYSFNYKHKASMTYTWILMIPPHGI